MMTTPRHQMPRGRGRWGALALAASLLGATWVSTHDASAKEAKDEEEVKVFKSGKSLTPVKKKIEKAKPTLTADTVVRSVDIAKAKSLRIEAFRGLKELIKETDKRDKDRPELLYRLAENYYAMSKAERFRARELDDKVYDCDHGKLKGPECTKAKNDRKKFDENSKKLLLEAFKNYVDIIKSHAGWKDMDKVLFATGYALHELKREDQAREFYKKLIKEHPDSPYVPDALLSFAEYYFYEGDMDTALRAYIKVAAYKDSKVYGFAIYKQAWCYYNLGDHDEAIKKFIEVLNYSKAGAAKGDRTKISLAKEARRDLVLAYSHVGTPGKAAAFFKKYGGDKWQDMLVRLGTVYLDQGKFEYSIAVHRSVIALDPASHKNHSYQHLILQASMAIGNKKEIVKEMHRLAALYRKMEEGGAPKPKVDEARRLTADTLREIATTWHREAQVTKNKDTYALASYVYKDYIDHFPKEKDIYMMTYYYADLLFKIERWEESAEYFLRVLALDPKGKRTEAAAKAAVIGYRNLKKLDEAKRAIKDIDTGDDDDGKGAKKKKTLADFPPKELKPLDKKIIRAYEIYMKYLPKGDKIIEVMYDYARIYYDAHQFDKAQPYFEKVVAKSDHYLAPFAGNLLLDILNLKGDYKTMKVFVERWIKDPHLSDPEKAPEFIEVMTDIYEWNKFQYCGQLSKAEDHALAGLCFHNFVDEFAESKRRYEAMYNAALSYEKARKVGLAIKLRTMLSSEYGDKEHGMDSGYVVGQLYMDLAVYSKAAEKFVEFAEAHPKHKDASGALSNAALFMEGLGLYDDAIALNRKYVAKYAKDPKKKVESALRFFRIAKIYEKKGDAKNALKIYGEYVKKYGKKYSYDSYFEARLALVKEKTKGKKDAKDYKEFAKIVAEFDKLPDKTKESAAKEGLLTLKTRDAVAEAAFMISEPEYAAFTSVSLPDDVPPEPEKMTAALKKWLEAKEGRLKSTVEVYKKVIRYGSLDWSLAALCRIGQIFNNFKTQLYSAPVPDKVTYEIPKTGELAKIPTKYIVKALKEKGLKDKYIKTVKGAIIMEHKFTEDEKYDYKDRVEELGDPLETLAIDGFKRCLDTAREKEWFNRWSKTCEKELNGMEPSKYPMTSERFPTAKKHAVDVLAADPVLEVAEE